MEWLNGTLGDAAMLASNTVKLSVSPLQMQQSGSQKKKKRRKGSVNFRVMEQGPCGTRILTAKQEERRSRREHG